MRKDSVHIGTSGYSYQHWREIFYPVGLGQGKWLEFYAQHFDSLEINATFYRAFPRSVYEKWHERTPPGFCFVLKGPKTMTRDKRLADTAGDLENFFAAAGGLQEKLSAVLWQMPPSFKNDAETLQTLDAFLSLLPQRMRHAVEFRHRSWCAEEVFNLLDQHKAGWVSADSSRYVSVERTTGGFGYYRFHGPKALYASAYSQEELEAWAQRIKENATAEAAYCFFNNDFHGHALTNATLLKELLR